MAPSPLGALPRSWFERDALEVAPELLHKVLLTEIDGEHASGRIVEVEAYREDDPASHTYRGRTPRTAAMFGPPGHLYVYLSYGLHHCANVVVGPDGSGQAVLVRAVTPLDGLDTIRRRRGDRPARELANGPGKVCAALGIDLRHYGVDLTDPDAAVRVADDGTLPPAAPVTGPRVGISVAIDVPWRFTVP